MEARLPPADPSAASNLAPRRSAAPGAIIRRVPTAQIFAERFAAQGLSGPPQPDPTAVAGRLLAVQGQDPRGFRLAVRARTEGLAATDVDRALSEERSLLVTWLNRGTLHLVRSEDYPWLQMLTTPPLLTSCARRLRQEGIAPEVGERAVGTIEKALAGEGPLTRAQLRERLDSAGIADPGPGPDPPPLPRCRARGDGAWADERHRTSLRPRPRLARRAGADRSRRGPGGARAPLPHRTRPRR